MRALKGVLLAAAMGGAMFGSAAQAVVIIPVSTGPFFRSGDPAGVIPAGTFMQGTNTYDFTFTTVGSIYDTLMQMQATDVKTGIPSTLSFTLFKGLPGSGVFVANSGGTPTTPTLLIVEAGTYYWEVNTTNAPRELTTGGLTLLSSIPEPAGWALMLLGFGALGVVARDRRRAIRNASA
jgi:hypothetical protein